MVRIKGKEYSGHVIEGIDEITVIVNTTEEFPDIVGLMVDVTEVTAYDGNGNAKSYVITVPVAASVVSPNIYAVRLSTKPTQNQRQEAKNQELSDAIDDILVMMLEG